MSYEIIIHAILFCIVYILPPLINAYGKVFSVAELIASGYVSLVSTSGIMPTIDIRTLYRPVPRKTFLVRIFLRFYFKLIVIGSNVPVIDSITGGFIGGVLTRYRWFYMPEPHGTLVDNLSYDFSQQDGDNYRSPNYPRNKYKNPKHRPYHKGNRY
jgi:hypothetical protein